MYRQVFKQIWHRGIQKHVGIHLTGQESERVVYMATGAVSRQPVGQGVGVVGHMLFLDCNKGCRDDALSGLPFLDIYKVSHV